MGGHKLYVATPRGVYESGDKGSTWQAIEALVGVKVLDMAASRDRLFVCLAQRLQVHDDGGPPTEFLTGEWQQVEIHGGKVCAVSAAGRPENLRILIADAADDEPQWQDISPSSTELRSLVFPDPGSGQVSAIVVPDVLVVGNTILTGIMVAVEGTGEESNGGLFGSYDGGHSWQRIPLGDPSERVVVARIVRDPADASHLLALLTDPEEDRQHPLPALVFESIDGGVSWQSATSQSYRTDGITDAYILGSVTYLTGFKSRDFLRLKGGNLTLLELPKPAWYTLEVEVDGGRIVVRLDGVQKLEYVDDQPLAAGSIAFEALADSTIDIDDVSIAVTRGPSRLYAGTAGYGLYAYDPASGKWQHLGRSLGAGWWAVWERRIYQFSSLLFDAEEPGRAYLGHFPGGFFVSEDSGRNWRDSSLGLGNDGIFSLVRHPHDRQIFFAGTYNGVVKSSDGGRTWQSKSTGMPREQWPYTIAIDSDRPHIMCVSTKNGQNKGFCSRNEFCGVVMKSTDGGESWIEIMNGLDRENEFYTLLIYRENHDVLFMSTSQGAFISRNAGASWDPINEGLPTTVNQVRDNVAQNLAFTNDHAHLLLGLMGHGVWRADLSRLQLGP